MKLFLKRYREPSRYNNDKSDLKNGLRERRFSRHLTVIEVIKIEYGILKWPSIFLLENGIHLPKNN